MPILRRPWMRLALFLLIAALLLAPVRIPYRVLWLAAAALALVLIETGSVAALGLRRARWGQTLVWGIGLALFAAGLIGELVQPAIERLLGTPADYSGYGALEGNAGAAARMWGYALLSAALGEEIVTRGFFLHQLNGILGRRARGAAVVIAATVFAFAHAKQGTAGVIATGLIGLGFGWAWFRTDRNLWALVLAHALTDTYGVAQMYFGRFG